MLYRDLQASVKNYKDDGLTEIDLNSSYEILEAELERLETEEKENMTYEDLQAMLGRYKSKGISGIELNSSFEELREQLERIEEAEQDEDLNNYLF